MMKNLLCLLVLLCPLSAFAQDTLNVIYYNVLNYPNVANNDPLGNDNARAIAFREIMEAADADIIFIEELKSEAGADLLKNELNNNSLGKVFDRAPQFFGYGSTTLGNMIFFNTNLANLLQQKEVPRINTGIAPDGTTNIAPRPNSYYELEVFSPDSPADKDTLHCFVGHFKASNNPAESFLIADNERRVLSVLDMMDYINTNLLPDDNIIAGGDFNFYSHLADNVNAPTYDEPAYDSLMNPVSYPIHFIDKQGGWTRNSSASAALFTQSTRLNYNEYGNEGASAGLDDRFDFALINDALDLGLKKTRYIEGSNVAFGSANQVDVAVTSGNSPVKNQLHQMSDHLPVFMQLELNFSTVCEISGVSATGDCQGFDYVFDVGFNSSNTSSTFEVYDVTNDTILATGNASPITVTIPGIMNDTPFDIVIRDGVDSLCASTPVTVSPVNCSTVCGISINSVTPTCLADDFYDLEVCFDYQNPESSDVNILVDGLVFGPYPFPAASGDCIVIPGATLNMTGDATPAVSVQVENAVAGGSACLDTAVFDEPDCITPNCTILLRDIVTTCLPDSTYDLDICFDYIDTLTSQVNITIDSVLYGPFDYPATPTGGCVHIPAAMLGLVGDATPGMQVLVEDVASNMAIATDPFISEFHYDNVSTDVGEFIEITAADGTDLADYTLYFYNGSNNLLYGELPLSGIISNMTGDCEAMVFTLPFNFQNGPDGIALVHNATSTVLEFISYEGVITALEGPALGMTSIDIMIRETSSTQIGESVQKTDAGWVGPIPETPGVINDGLTTCSSAGTICEASGTYDEPDCQISTCPVDLLLETMPILDSVYQVSNNITSNSCISDGSNVIFDAGVDIDLLPEFCVPLGAEFQCIIGGCVPE